MKTGVHHSDRPTFFWQISTQKKNAPSTENNAVSYFKKKCEFHKIPMLRIVVWRVLRVCSNYSLCCGGSTLCIKLDLYQRDQLNVEALVYLSMWFKVCTCPKLIEWQIRFFPHQTWLSKAASLYLTRPWNLTDSRGFDKNINTSSKSDAWQQLLANKNGVHL